MAVVSPWHQALPLKGTRATPLFKVNICFKIADVLHIRRTPGKLGPRQVFMAFIEWATRVLQRYYTVRGHGENLRRAPKKYLGSDHCLQLGNVKAESSVIANQHVAVKVISLSRVLTACHTRRV